MARQYTPFTFDDSLAPYAVPLSEWHRTHSNKYGGLVAAALVFDPQGRILLVRRAAHDFLPGYWEPPGGSVDNLCDESILHACVRELKEEASLTARRVESVVGEGNEFNIGERLYRRLTFIALWMVMRTWRRINMSTRSGHGLRKRRLRRKGWKTGRACL